MYDETLLPPVKYADTTDTSADPEKAASVFHNFADEVIRQRFLVEGIVPVSKKQVQRPIKPVESPTISCNPEIAPAVFVHYTDVIASNGMPILLIMSIMIELIPGSVVVRETADYAAKPHDATAIFIDVGNGNAVASLPTCLLELYMDELIGVGFQLIHLIAGANPEIAARITENRFHVIAAQAGWNPWIAREVPDTLVNGIKTVQSRGRGYPN